MLSDDALILILGAVSPPVWLLNTHQVSRQWRRASCCVLSDTARVDLAHIISRGSQERKLAAALAAVLTLCPSLTELSIAGARACHPLSSSSGPEDSAGPPTRPAAAASRVGHHHRRRRDPHQGGGAGGLRTLRLCGLTGMEDTDGLVEYCNRSLLPEEAAGEPTGRAELAVASSWPLRRLELLSAACPAAALAKCTHLQEVVIHSEGSNQQDTSAIASFLSSPPSVDALTSLSLHIPGFNFRLLHRNLKRLSLHRAELVLGLPAPTLPHAPPALPSNAQALPNGPAAFPFRPSVFPTCLVGLDLDRVTCAQAPLFSATLPLLRVLLLPADIRHEWDVFWDLQLELADVFPALECLNLAGHKYVTAVHLASLVQRLRHLRLSRNNMITTPDVLEHLLFGPMLSVGGRLELLKCPRVSRAKIRHEWRTIGAQGTCESDPLRVADMTLDSCFAALAPPASHQAACRPNE